MIGDVVFWVDIICWIMIGANLGITLVQYVERCTSSPFYDPRDRPITVGRVLIEGHGEYVFTYTPEERGEGSP